MDYQEKIMNRLSTCEPQKILIWSFEPPEDDLDEDINEPFPCGCLFDEILCTETLELKAECCRLWASGDSVAYQHALENYHLHFEEQEES